MLLDLTQLGTSKKKLTSQLSIEVSFEVYSQLRFLFYIKTCSYINVNIFLLCCNGTYDKNIFGGRRSTLYFWLHEIKRNF